MARDAEGRVGKDLKTKFSEARRWNKTTMLCMTHQYFFRRKLDMYSKNKHNNNPKPKGESRVDGGKEWTQ
jgi:hypothetical protein